MIIVALSDLHGDVSRLPVVEKDLSRADLVLLTGDLTHFGGREEARQVVHAVRDVNPSVLAVPGNCDYPEVDVFLSDEGINLHCCHEIREGIALLGVGGSLPCPGTTPNEMGDEEFASCLFQAAEGLDRELPLVLVTHQPPQGTVADRLKSGIHVGSDSLRSFIVENKPLICFTGHIHEGVGVDSIGPTKIINPGPLGYGRYAYAKVSGLVEELEIRRA